MALRNAYKQRIYPDGDDREQLGSVHSVEALTRGGNRSHIPGDTGKRVSSKTNQVIENAFGFLKDSFYDTYSRYGSDGETDGFEPFAYKDNFTFGPPRTSAYRPSGGLGPTSRSYDGDAPKDRRYPLHSSDQMSYADDIPEGLSRTTAGNMGNGHLSNGLVPNRFGIKRLPRITETNNNNSRKVLAYSYDPRREPRIGYYEEDYNDRHRPYTSYPYPDDASVFTEDDWYPGDENRPDIARYPEPNGNYRYHSNGVADYPESDPEYSKNGKSVDSERLRSSSSSRGRCLFIFILVVGLIIIAGIVTVIALNFLGYFSSKPTWADGYDVEAIFINEYNSALDDKNSEHYKEEAKKFKLLTNDVLNNGGYQGDYRVEVNNITKGSTKYVFVVEMAKKTNSLSLQTLLQHGYKAAFVKNNTQLIFKSVKAKVNEKYATVTSPTTESNVETTTSTSSSSGSNDGESTTSDKMNTSSDTNSNGEQNSTEAKSNVETTTSTSSSSGSNDGESTTSDNSEMNTSSDTNSNGEQSSTEASST